MPSAWIGLGGNVGDVRRNMAAALGHLDRNARIAVRQVSSLYRTPPWGVTDQPEFLNACAELSIGLSPRELLQCCLAAEAAQHRERTKRWGPRTIDIDILLIEGVEIAEEGLGIPHPRLKERAFALLPLAELAPEAKIDGQLAAAWLARLDSSGISVASSGGGWWRA